MTQAQRNDLQTAIESDLYGAADAVFAAMRDAGAGPIIATDADGGVVVLIPHVEREVIERVRDAVRG